jgi:hypothetical protein
MAKNSCQIAFFSFSRERSQKQGKVLGRLCVTPFGLSLLCASFNGKVATRRTDDANWMLLQY